MSFIDSLIEEFRANGGVVTRPYADSTLVLLSIRGARSGRVRTLPIEYMDEGGSLYVFGTKGGAPETPAWVYNLRANPEVTVEYLTDRFPAIAHEITGEERDRLWNELVRRKPRFGEYETKTSRIFPVFRLDRGTS
jgi:deazaflavin-dependent oxidoreductase (nitroreductase family)